MRKHWIFFILLASLLLASCNMISTPEPISTAEPTAAPTSTVEGGTTTEVAPTKELVKSPPATCRPSAVIPEMNPTVVAILEPLTEKEWARGAENPKMTIIEYSDFQCPACAATVPALEEFVSKHEDEVRLIFRHNPLASIHDKAELAAQAAEAAGEQGKFWEMHDILFTKQSEWNSLSSADFTTWVTDQAKGLGLDTANFTATMTAEATAKRVKASEEHAQTSGINSTPFLFVNNLPYGGRRDVESLTSLLEFFKLEDRAYDTCPEMTIDPNKKYTATIKTERGDVVIELFADKAPWAVNSFVFLAREGWYDNTPFHRVIANFVAQGGDPSGSGFGSPGYVYTNEIDPSLRFDKAGVVALANSGADTNGSQFFITYGPQPDLDGNFTIFGYVINGMDIVGQLRPRNPEQDVILLPADMILSITIEEK